MNHTEVLVGMIIAIIGISLVIYFNVSRRK